MLSSPADAQNVSCQGLYGSSLKKGIEFHYITIHFKDLNLKVPKFHSIKIISEKEKVLKLDFFFIRSHRGVSKSPSLTMNEEWQTMFGGSIPPDRNSPSRNVENP